MKIKTFYGRPKNFEKRVNSWLEQHPNIEIKDRYFSKDWESTNGFGTAYLQFYGVFIYTEKPSYFEPNIFED